MNKLILMLYIALVMAGTAYAQQSESNLKTARKDLAKAREDLKQAKKDSIAEYQQFKRESQEKIAANEKAVAELKVKNATKNKETNADYDKKIQVLEDKNIVMQNRINDYKADGNTNWTRFKRQFNKEMKALQKSFMESRD